MRMRLDEEAGKLDGLFRRFGVPVAGGTSLYRFIDSAAAPGLFRALGGKGILLRHFVDRPDVLRAGLPASREEWRRLEEALADWARTRDDRTEEARA
jgi:cobalamin biosynthetic protein CobC